MSDWQRLGDGRLDDDPPSDFGDEEGEVCGRGDPECVGVMEIRASDKSCLCHIHPPCAACIESVIWCPTCGEEA